MHDISFSSDQLLIGYCMMSLSAILIVLILIQLKNALTRTAYSRSKRNRILAGTATAAALWMIYSGVLAASGFIGEFSMPPRLVVLIIVPALVIILFIVLTGRADEILRKMSPRFVTGIQAFRIPVEIMLWRSYVNGYTPVQMTLEGLNFDILSGISAVIVAWFAVKNGKLNHTLLFSWNLICLLLLANIVIIAMLSFPSPFRVFMNEPANYLVTCFPFVYLPAVLVPVAYTFHAFSLRQLKLLRDGVSS